MSFWEVSATESPVAVFTTLLVGSVLKHALGFWIKWNSRRQLVKVGTVSALYIYPVKSFRGLCIQEATVGPVGLEYHGVTDRHWTVATQDGVYLTQRQEPTMALIVPSLHDDQIHFDAPGMTTLRLPINPTVDPSMVRKVTVKTDTVDSLDCGVEAAQWLCRYLNRTGLSLHFSAPSLEKRDAHNAQKMWEHPAKVGDLTAFSDYCGYMVLSNASLNALNSRLATPVPITNFRANIIVDDCDAFAEDDWAAVHIGQAALRVLDSCTRCILVTVDQTKGVKTKGEEPLTTLKSFRKMKPYGEKPAFGINATHIYSGIIRVGDPIFAIRR